ncbi:hypothetical protein D3C72_934390 [compost metagenome]
MKLKTIARTSMIWALSLSMAIPHSAYAGVNGKSVFSIFEDDDDTADTGIIPSNPNIPNGNNNGNNGNNNNNNNNNGNNNGGFNNNNNNNNGNNNGGSFFPGNGQRPGGNNNNGNFNNNNNNNPPKVTMSKANVAEAYQCPLFSSTAHADLIKSIDELTKQVSITPDCAQDTSVKSIETNNKTIKTSIESLETMMKAADPNTVSVEAVSAAMTGALQALGSIGDMINSQSFLNSACGKQTMSAGKVLLSFNDMVNGLTPYALFAVAMNAALAPALPFVVAGAIATTGISVLGKMFDEKSIDLNNPNHREAVLVNVCQYTKVAKKVRFMQLAQSGKIDKITSELSQEVDLYSAQINDRSRKISELLKYRTSVVSDISSVENQLNNDRQDISGVEEQIAKNNDDFTTCTFARELVNWAADGKSFPASAIVNLDRASQQADRTTKLKVLNEKTLHENSMRKIVALGDKSLVEDATLKSCAEVGRSWMAGIRRSVKLTSDVVYYRRNQLENELNQNAEYREWKAKYTMFEQQKLTIQRVSKVMEQLSQDDSIINRSELAQKMTLLKAGLFGRTKSVQFIGGKPPVLQWIEHTKTKHDMAVAAFTTEIESLRNGAWSLTDTGRNIGVKALPKGGYYVPSEQRNRDENFKKDLSNLNLKTLPLGSREHDVACQYLENAWVDWAASLDHLGAIQFFCDMIDPVLDVNMDPRILEGCRGNVKLNGTTVYPSIVNQAKQTLIRGNFKKDASIISARLKELQCPIPSVTVMNE